MNQKTVTGVITTTRSGLGFVSNDTHDRDIRIEHEDLNTALNGDTVELVLKGKHAQGAVTKIIKRSKEKFVGVLEQEKGFWFLVPDDRRMYVDILIPDPPADIKNGQKALVQFTKWDDPAQDPIGTVLDVLGTAGEHNVEIQSIVLDRGIDTTFPHDVQQEATTIKQKWESDSVDMIASAISDGARKDFRNTTTFTIDPHDAKDFDDALSFKKTSNGTGYEIGIHIADVSHFVHPGSTLDQEAKTRGFSTYLVDRTIPMLPEELSNDLCSLNPDTDRLTFSATFILDKNAEVHERWFGKGVIHSDKRFSYTDAQKVLDTKNGPYAEELTALNNLSKKLRDRRIKSGSIDFEQQEVEVELNDDNTPSRIYRKKLLDTNKMIEDFMLLANREVATYIFKAHKGKKDPRGFLYRVHDLPDPEKIEQISALLEALGYPALRAHGRGRKRKTSIHPSDINELFKQIEGTAIENMIKTAMIRAMAKATYTTKNIGHFGLGFSYYTHFTSPIRRYPDLLVHRLLERHIDGSEITTEEAQEHTQLAWELSQKEASIQEAERESIKYKQAEYWNEHIGTTVTGVITGVTDWGFYVEENETGTDGLVRVSALNDDYYVYDEKHYRLTGKRTKKTYALGDTITVKVAAVDIERRTIDFIVV